MSMTWQPMESAPKDGMWILTIAKNGAGRWTIPTSLRWFQGRWDNAIPETIVYHLPTHWMPLPDPPVQA